MPDNQNNGAAGAFRFRVSDSLEVPLRGHMLRLKLIEGSPSMKDLSRGHQLRVESPAGTSRSVRIIGHSATGGRATQKRLDTTRELDVVIPAEDAGAGRDRIGIGWVATGPVR
jgi:hypothetical protein